MKTFERYDDLASWRGGAPGPVAVVPTMGSLHEGHLTLVRAARRAARTVVVTVFVNPTQFGDPEDLRRYPRDPARDLSLLRPEGVDAVWLPAVADVYPPGFDSAVTVGGVTDAFEGRFRPGHFAGVATVVTILFGAVRPDLAFFGEKDYQQLAVVRKLVSDLKLGVGIHGVPTVRETDGLAMSSRNARLGPGCRAAAATLFTGLSAAAARFAAGERTAGVLVETARARFDASAEVEYLGVADGLSLVEKAEASPGDRLLVAARLGGVRLIDNVPLGE